jgi:hypothetical protein
MENTTSTPATETPARKGFRLVPCDGAAHSNAHVDNCGRCAPRWGWVEVPVGTPDGMVLSKNQVKFVVAARRAGHQVVFNYSGRGMFGERCPAVYLDGGESFSPRASTRTDSMGLGTVVYAQD